MIKYKADTVTSKMKTPAHMNAFLATTTQNCSLTTEPRLYVFWSFTLRYETHKQWQAEVTLVFESLSQNVEFLLSKIEFLRRNFKIFKPKPSALIHASFLLPCVLSWFSLHRLAPVFFCLLTELSLHTLYKDYTPPWGSSSEFFRFMCVSLCS